MCSNWGNATHALKSNVIASHNIITYMTTCISASGKVRTFVQCVHNLGDFRTQAMLNLQDKAVQGQV
jgi:hypothetical protein